VPGKQQRKLSRWEVGGVCMTRLSGIHWCSPNTQFFSILCSIWAYGANSRWRSLLQIHTGEPVELRYALNAFGISSDNLPVTWTGKIKLNYHKQWMKLRTCIETNQIIIGIVGVQV